jgi:hypothetical protein
MTKKTSHSDNIIELTNFVNDADVKRDTFLAQAEACQCNQCSNACVCTCQSLIGTASPSSAPASAAALLTGMSIQPQATG